MTPDDEGRRLLEQIQRRAAELQAQAEAEMAAATARMNAEIARSQAVVHQALQEHAAIERAEFEKLRARGIADPEAHYRAAQAKGRELASREWEQFEREMLPRRADARARLTGAALDREMIRIDAEIDAKVALRAAELARQML